MSAAQSLPPAVRQRFAAPVHALPVAQAAPLRPGQRRVCGSAGAVERGTAVRFELAIDGERIASAAFRAYGCPYTIAVCDWVAAELADRAWAQGVPGTPEQWARTLAVPLDRLGRLFVIEDALKQCFC